MVLDRSKLEDINTYLQTHQLLLAGERVLGAEKPGEGNMNYVVRAVLPNRTLIIKQARAYVEKYPTIAAPEERAIIEGTFYNMIAANEVLKRMMPALYKVDETNHIIVLEDLGQSTDFSSLYKKGAVLSIEEAQSLVGFLSELHNNFATANSNELMANRSLRALNHEHIFVYPLMEDNGFDLDTVQQSLQQLSLQYKKNDLLKRKAAELGKIYLQDGPTLLHGDYYPGSWLKTDAGVKVIDPEFCFYGRAEFDLGVMLAHLAMSQQEDALIQQVKTLYKKPAGFDDNLLNAFTGIEIIRRIIGLAQLPLALSLQEKEALLEHGIQLLNIN